MPVRRAKLTSAAANTGGDQAMPASRKIHPHQVLVRAPELRHIPIFALGVEGRREAVEHSVSTSNRAALAAVGRNAAQGLRQGRYGAFQVVTTRQRLARQSAIYSLLLAFKTRAGVATFRADYPRLCLDKSEGPNE